MSVKLIRPSLKRRSLIAAAPALALGAAWSNHAQAQSLTQSASDDLPDASTGWETFPAVTPPALEFQDKSGKSLTLQHYKGHVLLVNLWATWCGPCTEELPGLAALAPKLKLFGGLILPISIDTDGLAAVRPFFELRGVKDLPMLLNPSGDDLDMMQTNGIPVTMVVDPDGKAVARLDGAANWNTKGVVSYLRHLAGKHPANPDGFVAT